MADLLALFAVVEDRLHAEQVNDSLEPRFGAHRDLQRQRGDPQLLLDLLDHLLGVGPNPVHLVDERDAGNLVPLHLAVDRQRLALHPTDRAQHQDGAVEHAERTFDFDGEVHVPRGVDDIDGVVFPGDAGTRRGDGDAPLFFELHVVHHRAVAIPLHFVHAVNPS